MNSRRGRLALGRGAGDCRGGRSHDRRGENECRQGNPELEGGQQPLLARSGPARHRPPASLLGLGTFGTRLKFALDFQDGGDGPSRFSVSKAPITREVIGSACERN